MKILKHLFPIFFIDKENEDKEHIDFTHLKKVEDKVRTIDDIILKPAYKEAVTIVRPIVKKENRFECSFYSDMKHALDGYERQKTRKQYQGTRTPIKGTIDSRVVKEFEDNKNKDFMVRMLGVNC